MTLSPEKIAEMLAALGDDHFAGIYRTTEVRVIIQRAILTELVAARSKLDALTAEKEANYDLWPDDPAPIADKAADHVFKDFAKLLGLETWYPQDGSETWEGDVWATAVRMLEDAGVLDHETGERPDWQSRALAAEARLARQEDALKALDDYWTADFPGGPEGSRVVMGGLGTIADDTIEIWRKVRSALKEPEL